MQTVIGDFNRQNFRIHLSGSPVVIEAVNRIGVREMKLFLGLSGVSIGVLLFILFRRVSGVVLPPFIVGLATASTLGLMALGLPSLLTFACRRRRTA